MAVHSETETLSSVTKKDGRPNAPRLPKRPIRIFYVSIYNNTNDIELAERVGFEPTVGFPRHSLSRRAPSTARTPLRRATPFYSSWVNSATTLILQQITNALIALPRFVISGGKFVVPGVEFVQNVPSEILLLFSGSAQRNERRDALAVRFVAGAEAGH
jgi:hypothetical protein